MALKQIMLGKKIEQRKARLEELLRKEQELLTREAEAEKAAEEARSEEEIKAVEEEADKLEAEKKELDEEKQTLESEIASLEGELAELNSKTPDTEERTQIESGRTAERVGNTMGSRHKIYKGMTREQIQELLTREDVKGFLERVRTLGEQGRSVNMAEVTVPTSLMDMLRDTVYEHSKMLKRVNYRAVKGNARKNISGTIPEAVWTEMNGVLNELELSFSQIEVDGYKVGGFIPVDNDVLKDSDEDLAAIIISSLGKAIAKALDKAIFYGKGGKQPLGIVTRLMQTKKPDGYSDKAPAWKDLHVSHVLKATKTGAALFGEIITAFANCKNDYSGGEKFFAMSTKTFAKLMSELLNFNAAGALVSGMNNQMPVIGGDIEIFDFINDGDIIGGYGDLYALIEREGVTISASDQVKFIEDQTVFKGLARYDGCPTIAEGFFVVNINNIAPTASMEFAKDYANMTMGTLSVVSAANASETGKTDITISGGEASGTTFGYKVSGKAENVKCGAGKTGYKEITSGASITAKTGEVITVVEFDENGKAIKMGSAQVIAKA